MREDCLAASILCDQDFHVHLLSAVREILPQYRHAVFANSQIVKGKHAHNSLLFARPVWLTHSARLNALSTPAAEWTMSTSAVIFNLSGCWLSGSGMTLWAAPR